MCLFVCLFLLFCVIKNLSARKYKVYGTVIFPVDLYGCVTVTSKEED